MVRSLVNLKYITHFIAELKSLVIFITGSNIVKRRSIKVEDEVGSILARTCSKLIIFPRGLFKEEDEAFKFADVMNSIIDWNGIKFNTV